MRPGGLVVGQQGGHEPLSWCLPTEITFDLSGDISPCASHRLQHQVLWFPPEGPAGNRGRGGGGLGGGALGAYRDNRCQNNHHNQDSVPFLVAWTLKCLQEPPAMLHFFHQHPRGLHGTLPTKDRLTSSCPADLRAKEHSVWLKYLLSPSLKCLFVKKSGFRMVSPH